MTLDLLSNALFMCTLMVLLVMQLWGRIPALIAAATGGHASTVEVCYFTSLEMIIVPNQLGLSRSFIDHLTLSIFATASCKLNLFSVNLAL